MLSQECIHVTYNNSTAVHTVFITNTVPRYVCSSYVPIVVLLRVMYCPPKFLYAYEWFFCIHRNHYTRMERCTYSCTVCNNIVVTNRNIHVTNMQVYTNSRKIH